ncbi:DUF3108 domain-containing protein [Ciceribacter selenitireducens]|uniref:DUF3108 domain-containing protein n=1 Tax=Ciceribacter selenitireducens TaxID=448181 RepID=UPI00048FAAB8|nr:DUF3108 domain-containing protein [Ciceribacter selenitireducens]
MRFLNLVCSLLVFAVAPAAAESVRYRTDYRVTLGALPIARASFVTEVNQKNYTITGSFNSSAIVNVITKISARTDISGTLTGDRMQADRYTLVYQSGKKKQTYDVRYSAGDVTETIVHPEPKRRPRNWIAVGPEDLKSVLDPISGLIIPEGEAACPRTLPIYDGESRMDLVLTPKGRKSFTIDDVENEAIVCSIRYVPKSGFRKGRKDIEYLRKAEGMEIWFAKTGTLKVYAPVYARVPTQMGTIYVSAVGFDD